MEVLDPVWPGVGLNKYDQDNEVCKQLFAMKTWPCNASANGYERFISIYINREMKYKTLVQAIGNAIGAKEVGNKNYWLRSEPTTTGKRRFYVTFEVENQRHAADAFLLIKMLYYMKNINE